jgi:hypothetical protein
MQIFRRGKENAPAKPILEPKCSSDARFFANDTGHLQAVAKIDE